MERDRQRGNDLGPTGETVAANVKRVRQAAGLTQEELSKRLALIKRPIPKASIGKIESGLRKVEVDDLMALSVALDTSPLGLLLPVDLRPSDYATITNEPWTEAEGVWAWALAQRPLSGMTDTARFIRRSLPGWLTVEMKLPAERERIDPDAEAK